MGPLDLWVAASAIEGLGVPLVWTDESHSALISNRAGENVFFTTAGDDKEVFVIQSIAEEIVPAHAVDKMLVFVTEWNAGTRFHTVFIREDVNPSTPGDQRIVMTRAYLLDEGVSPRQIREFAGVFFAEMETFFPAMRQALA